MSWTDRQLAGPAIREKTKILKLRGIGQTLDLLGYTFRLERSLSGRGACWRVEASPKALEKERQAIRELTSARWCFQPIQDTIMRVTRQVRGWLNYFRVGHPERVRRRIVRFAENRVVRHLRRRSQRPYRPPKGTDIYEHIRSLGPVFP